MLLIDNCSMAEVIAIFPTGQLEPVTYGSMQQTNLTLEAIVSGILAGESAYEQALYEKYQPGLRLMLEKRTGDRARAEDLCQDALLIVLLKLRSDGLRQPEALTAYIYQTAKFVHLGWLRKSSTQVERYHDSSDEVVIEENPETLQMRQQEIAATRDLISEMSVARDREILTRYYVDDQEKHDICEVLQLTAEHFDRVIHRAKTRFKKLLEKRHGMLEEYRA